MEGTSIWALYIWIGLLYLGRAAFLLGISAIVLRHAIRRIPQNGVRRLVIAAVAAFWLVDLVPGTVGFWIDCQIHAGVRLDSTVPGQPHVAIGERLAPGLAARFLSAAGSVEYELSPRSAELLGLTAGFHWFQSIENSPTVCWVGAFRDARMLELCAQVDNIPAPTARYLIDVSEELPRRPWTGIGLPRFSWWPKREWAFVFDREADETIATATLITRPLVTPFSGLFSLLPWSEACPTGSSRTGLPLVLIPAAFPELTEQ